MSGWRFRTGLMFIAMSAILMALGALISFALGSMWFYGAGIMLAISLIFCLFSYYKSKEMALKANGARIVTEAEYPRLYAIVREVAEKADLPMPQVGVVETNTANAFATGRNPKNAAVVATTGLMDLLPDDELRGVIAHEMSHVKNRDILVMSVASALAVIISYVSRMAYWAALFSDDRENKGAIILIALVAEIFVPFAALLIQLGISRNREFLADESGARMIGDPRALARALDHLERGNESTFTSYTLDDHKDDRHNPVNDYDYAHMWISNPVKKQGFLSKLFSTHPPMSERIARLNKIADEMGL